MCSFNLTRELSVAVMRHLMYPFTLSRALYGTDIGTFDVSVHHN